MAESPDGRGVLLFGGYYRRNEILEMRAGGHWHFLNITLKNGRQDHCVIPLH